VFRRQWGISLGERSTGGDEMMSIQQKTKDGLSRPARKSLLTYHFLLALFIILGFLSIQPGKARSDDSESSGKPRIPIIEEEGQNPPIIKAIRLIPIEPQVITEKDISLAIEGSRETPPEPEPIVEEEPDIASFVIEDTDEEPPDDLPEKARLKIVTNPAGAHILGIPSGREYGVTPATLEIDGGTYRFLLQRSGHHDVVISGKIATGGEDNFSLDLEMKRVAVSTRETRRRSNATTRSNGRSLSLALAAKGVTAQNWGQLVAARQHLERAVVADPTFAKAHMLLGGIQARQGDHKRALASFQRAGRLNPGDRNIRGAIHALRGRIEQDKSTNLARGLGLLRIFLSHVGRNR